MTATVTVQLLETPMKALIASLFLAGACASSGMHGGATSPTYSFLTVHNERSEDLTIYVMRSGTKGRRLGDVTGLNSATFALSESDAPIAADIQFLAASFVRSGHSVLSDPVTVQPGARYDWKLFAPRGHDVITAAYSVR